MGVTVTNEGMERIVEHASLAGMKKTYSKIEAASPDGIHYTRAFGQMPFIQKGNITQGVMGGIMYILCGSLF